ncbi:hypothetical protein [Streptomyces niveus]
MVLADAYTTNPDRIPAIPASRGLPNATRINEPPKEKLQEEHAA